MYAWRMGSGKDDAGMTAGRMPEAEVREARVGGAGHSLRPQHSQNNIWLYYVLLTCLLFIFLLLPYRTFT